MSEEMIGIIIIYLTNFVLFYIYIIISMSGDFMILNVSGRADIVAFYSD